MPFRIFWHAVDLVPCMENTAMGFVTLKSTRGKVPVGGIRLQITGRQRTDLQEWAEDKLTGVLTPLHEPSGKWQHYATPPHRRYAWQW